MGLHGTQGWRVQGWGGARTEGMGAHGDGGYGDGVASGMGAHSDGGHTVMGGTRGHGFRGAEGTRRLRWGTCGEEGRAGVGAHGSRVAAAPPAPPRQDVAFFDAHRTGQLVARLTADVQEFKSSFKLVISQVGPGTAPPPAPPNPPRHPPSPRPPAGPAQQHPGCGLCAVPLPAVPAAHGAAAAGAARVGERRRRAGLRAAGAVPPGAGTGNGGEGGDRWGPHPCGAPRSAAMSPSAQVAKATGVADEVLGNVRTVRAFAMEEQQAG